MLNNLTLARLFKQNMQSLGHKMPLGDATQWGGSTDVGNVSQLVPTIQPMAAIAPADVLLHSPEFARAAASEEGLRCILGSAKAMAMTVVDILASPETVVRVQKEFWSGRETRS